VPDYVCSSREEVLAGIDEDGKLYHVWGEDVAVGPRNVLYSLQTLLELEAEGVVAVSYSDAAGPPGLTFEGFRQLAEQAGSDWSGEDEEGTPGNDFPRTLKWVRAQNRKTDQKTI